MGQQSLKAPHPFADDILFVLRRTQLLREIIFIKLLTNVNVEVFDVAQ